MLDSILRDTETGELWMYASKKYETDMLKMVNEKGLSVVATDVITFEDIIQVTDYKDCSIITDTSTGVEYLCINGNLEYFNVQN